MTRSTPATRSSPSSPCSARISSGVRRRPDCDSPKLYNGKNKTFFFGAYEGFRYSRAANSFLHLPTDAELSGDLSGQAQAYNPFTTRPDPNKPGSFIRDPFPAIRFPQIYRHAACEFRQTDSAAAVQHGRRQQQCDRQHAVPPAPERIHRPNRSERSAPRTSSGSATAPSTMTRPVPAACLASTDHRQPRPELWCELGAYLQPGPGSAGAVRPVAQETNSFNRYAICRRAPSRHWASTPTSPAISSAASLCCPALASPGTARSSPRSAGR